MTESKGIFSTKPTPDYLLKYQNAVPSTAYYFARNCDFMRDGYFSKHLNRMRRIDRNKHEKLTRILETFYPDVMITGDLAGMHILISVPLSKGEDQLKHIAAKDHIAIYPLSDYLLSPIDYPYPTFLFGFGGIPLDQIEKGIHQLMQCWNYKGIDDSLPR